MEEDISTSRAALRPWARRAQKQGTRARSSSPPAARRTNSYRRTTSGDLQGAAAGALARQTSAGGSGERSIQAFLARSSREGDVPELISQVCFMCAHAAPCLFTFPLVRLDRLNTV